MSNVVISVENLSKSYRLGQIGTGTLSRDLEIWLAKLRGKPNPYLKIGQTDPSELDGETLWALRDVSFQVQQGEVLGIIGRNGAGKSTLLKILSRVTAPTSGQIKVKGRIASLLEVGTGFHPELTGRENIFLNGAILGMSKQEVQRKFDEIVSFAEVEKFVDTPVKRYSSGMYVRLAFAVAAHLESEILLVDEVLAVGDADFQKKCLGKMGDVATNEGRTVFFVSHNMGAVRTLCKTGILLENGRISYSDEISNIVEKYLIKNSLVENNEYIRPRKDCTSKVLLEKLTIEPPIHFDDCLCLIFDYSINENIEYFSIEWFIKDIYGQRILSGLSALSDRTWFIPKDKKGKIKCKMSNWRLPGGQYTISVIFTNRYKECFDYVENAITFTVNAQSVPETNFIYTSKYGYFLPEMNWIPIENTKLTNE